MGAGEGLSRDTVFGSVANGDLARNVLFVENSRQPSGAIWRGADCLLSAGGKTERSAVKSGAKKPGIFVCRQAVAEIRRADWRPDLT